MKLLLRILRMTLILGLGLSLVGGGLPVLANSQPESNFDRMVIQFEPGAAESEMDAVVQELGGRVVGSLPQIGCRVVEVPHSDVAASSIPERFRKVAGIELDQVAQAIAGPDDTYFARQWGMETINAPAAWDLATGSADVIIAILDTGIDTKHEDLAGKIVASENFSSSNTAEDRAGHGTHCAGTAAAISGNETGIAGLGYNASLMNVKVLGDNGSGFHSQIAEGIIWAADNGADVISMSLGGGNRSSVLQEAIKYAWGKGALVVAAAGNAGTSSQSYPACYGQCIAVAATDSADRLYSFSNYGSWVDVAAPGSSYSTLPGNRYGNMSGTSMAAPFVSGLAGLLFSIAKDADGDGMINDEVRDAIESTCADIGNRDFGRIDAGAAVASLISSRAAGIEGTVTDYATGRPIAGATISYGVHQVKSDANGRYKLSDIPAGAGALKVSAQYYWPAARAVALQAGQTLELNFRLKPLRNSAEKRYIIPAG